MASAATRVVQLSVFQAPADSDERSESTTCANICQPRVSWPRNSLRGIDELD